MCVTSTIFDWGKTVPEKDWEIPEIDRFRKLIEDAKKLDKALGQENCEDPEKEAILARLDAIEARLRALERGT